MNDHLLLPINNLENMKIIPIYKDWLERWYYKLEEDISSGDVAISDCYQGIISEALLYGKIKTDWIGILEEYLTSDQMPLAYSEAYGKRLYKFDNQWKQSPIHAIYAHWWIRGFLNDQDIIRNKFSEIITSLIQSNGWIYNPEVSNTQIRTRMKAELLMSFSMGTEILKHHNRLDEHKERLLATINNFSYTGYISAEYFRIKAYETLDFQFNPITQYDEIIDECVSNKGYCDFSIHSKVDDYMGTAKRIQRDKPIDSPLISVYVKYISNSLSDSSVQKVSHKLFEYGKYLNENPMNIPAFRMRDLDFPFGTDITPLEVISANNLIISVP